MPLSGPGQAWLYIRIVVYGISCFFIKVYGIIWMNETTSSDIETAVL
jgi:hypothetical protein